MSLESPIDDFGNQDRQMLTARLIRSAIAQESQGDSVLDAFAALVIPNLMRELAGCTAKGGAWSDARAGRIKSTRNIADQSLTSHLLNGLLPVATLIRRLNTLDTSVARYVDDKAYRLFIAGYVLHDWEKFPGVAQSLEDRLGAGFKPDPLVHRDLVSDYVQEWSLRLGINDFLAEGGMESIGDHIDTLIYISQNTQERYDTHRETSQFQLTMHERTCLLCADLTQMSDKLSSIVKRPFDVNQQSITDLLHRLSDGRLTFTYHSVSEVRGILTNVINNALIDAHLRQGYQSLLFFPDGVVYLGAANSGRIDADSIPDAVIEKIRALCADQLKRRFVGFGRDGKGMKFADYYWLFFSSTQLMHVAARAACKKIHEGSNPASGKRSASLVEFKRKGLLPGDTDIEFPDDFRIDLLAEFCDLVERKIIQEATSAGSIDESVDITEALLTRLGLTELRADFDRIANLNTAIKSAGQTGNTGGVPLAWYYAAAQYFRRPVNRGLSADEVAQLIESLASSLADDLAQGVKHSAEDGWGDVRSYVSNVVGLPGSEGSQPLERFASELDRYEKTKLRGGFRPCSLCSAQHTVEKQQEAGVLFAPQVFTNKQSLFGSLALRHICSICSSEMMLRQILMNRTQASGGDFEGSKYRYLYIYPMYYFSAETNRFLRMAYQNLRATNFRADVRNHLVNRETHEVDFSLGNFQRLDSLLIEEEPDAAKQDRVFKVQYPEDDPLTFFFAGLPPGRDATDTESWVMPVFLALVLPFVFDAKVVASESPVPLFNSGADFNETVFIDAPHSFAELLIRKQSGAGDRAAKLCLRLDEIEPNLRRLSAAYVIHLDASARQSKGGYDANWGKLSELARDLASSPLYVFHYLNVWLRQQSRLDAPPLDRVREYLKLYEYLDPEHTHMNHPRKLTELYRRFYRAKRPFAKANAVLKPIDLAADTILKADRSLFSQADDGLVDVVAAELNSLMQRVHRSEAEGRWVISISEDERRATREFAEYFVKEFFFGALKGDSARLAGTQLNLLRDTCDTLYREIDDRERIDKRAQAAAASGDSDSDSDDSQEPEE